MRKVGIIASGASETDAAVILNEDEEKRVKTEDLVLISNKCCNFHRVRSRIDKLCGNFAYYLRKFDDAKKFTGPSVYFHQRTLNRLESLGLPAALEDTIFLEYLYATLTAWGLHRMGPTGAKLVEFESFKKTLSNQKGAIASLQAYQLTHLPEQNLDVIVDALWNILSNLKVSETRTQIVAGSKALHHLLPKLMPPIDREYTTRFFYCEEGVKTVILPSGGEERIFKEIYPFFFEIASRNREVIFQHIGRGFHTSETKVIDNAIVGFVLEELKREEL